MKEYHVAHKCALYTSTRCVRAARITRVNDKHRVLLLSDNTRAEFSFIAPENFPWITTRGQPQVGDYVVFYTNVDGAYDYALWCPCAEFEASNHKVG
jgi:hypothetical protein